MAAGRTAASSHAESAGPSVFWYPSPVPARIDPRSRSGPHGELSGRARGMWVKRMVGAIDPPTLHVRPLRRRQGIGGLTIEVMLQELKCFAGQWSPCLQGDLRSQPCFVFVNETGAVDKNNGVIGEHE